jgi:hypothetical protein
MNSRNLVVVGPDDKEITRFLRLLIAAESVTVELESQRFRVTARPENVSGEARQVIRCGPVSDE